MDSCFACKQVSSVAVKHDIESRGHGVTSHAGTLANVILTFQLIKTDVLLIGTQSVTLKVTYDSSHLTSMQYIYRAQNKLGEDNPIISLNFKMNIVDM